MIFLLHEQREEDNRGKIHLVNGRKRFPSTSQVFVFFFSSKVSSLTQHRQPSHSPIPKAHVSLAYARGPSGVCVSLTRKIQQRFKLCGVSVGSGCNPMLQEMEVGNGEITLGGIMKEPSHSATFTGMVLWRLAFYKGRASSSAGDSRASWGAHFHFQGLSFKNLNNPNGTSSKSAFEQPNCAISPICVCVCVCVFPLASLVSLRVASRWRPLGALSSCLWLRVSFPSSVHDCSHHLFLGYVKFDI